MNRIRNLLRLHVALKILIPLLAVAVILALSIHKPLPDAEETDNFSTEINFLNALLTFHSEKLDELGPPSETYAEYLSETLGQFASEELLQQLLSSRTPFSMMEEGLCLTVRETGITPLDPTTAGENRSDFFVTADAGCSGEKTQQISFTGRMTKDPSTNLITDLHLNRMP